MQLECRNRADWIENKSEKIEILERLINLYHAIHLDEKAREFEDEYSKITGPPKPIQAEEKISRNAPCPCGSRKKYKKCCMSKESTRKAGGFGFTPNPNESEKFSILGSCKRCIQ